MATNNFKPSKQVGAEHYSVQSYLRPERMASFGYQLKLTIQHFPPPATILEVGSGSKLVTSLLTAAGYAVKTFDLAEDVEPDIVGSVSEMPLSDDEFGITMCCQVLEHMPWNVTKIAIRELYRVSKQGVILSVPTMVRTFDLKVYPTRIHVRFGIWSPWMRRNLCVPDQHYWELDAGVRESEFRSELKAAGFHILQEVRPTENLFHHFFVLCK